MRLSRKPILGFLPAVALAVSLGASAARADINPTDTSYSVVAASSPIAATALSKGTFPYGCGQIINNTGLVAGYCADANNLWTACTWKDGALTFVNTANDGVLDDCFDTEIGGMNANNQIVGYGYYNTDNWYMRGFYWSSGVMTEIAPLATNDLYCEPIDINDAGQVLAYSQNEVDWVYRGFVWQKGTPNTVTPLNYTEKGKTYPIDPSVGGISASGQVIGRAWLTDTYYPAVYWQGGTATLVNSGANCEISYINSSGLAVGSAELAGVNPWFYKPGVGMKTINVTGRYSTAPSIIPEVRGINDLGQVVIAASDFSHSIYDILLWQDDGTAGGAFTVAVTGSMLPSGKTGVGAVGINSQGQVIGTTISGSSSTDFLWSPSSPSTIQTLGVLTGDSQALSYDINDSGVIAGASYTSGYAVHPCTWGVAPPSTNNPPQLSGVPASLTVNELVACTFTATASDPDGNAVTLSVTGAPAGSTFNAASGVFSWTPTEAQGPGTYTFTVNATDNGSPPLTTSKSVTITVTEVNQAPTLSGVPASLTVNEMTACTFTAIGSDPDGNTVTFSIAGAPAGATISSATGVFSWTPTEAQGPGTYTFTVTATDNGTPPLSTSKSITITVNEVNRPPVLSGVPSSLTVSELATCTFTATASDPDGNAVTLSVTGAPAGSTFNAATGVFSWTPTASQGPGTYTFTVNATDNGTPPLAASKSVTITVTGVNNAPTLSGVPASLTVNEQVACTFTAVGSDPDGNAVTLSVVGAPAGSTFNAATGVFSWTPTEAEGPGTYTFTVNATDNGTPALTTSKSITITVNEVNLPPVLTVPPYSVKVLVGASVVMQSQATDPDIPANTLTFRATNAPAGSIFDTATGRFTWTPAQAGTFSFDVTVTDAGGLSDSGTATITVEAPTSLPLTFSTATLARKGKTATVTVKTTLNNPNNQPAANTYVNSATLAGTATVTSMPIRIGTVRAGASKSVSLSFKNVPAGSATLVIQGTCSLGAFSTTQQVTVPS